MTEATAFIYYLCDPRDPSHIRYVGKAKNTTSRLKKHISDVYKRPGNHRLCWIKSLLTDGVSPKLVIIEGVAENNWQERERFWISKFRSDGHNLTNSTDGGDGIVNLTEFARKRISEAHKGKIITAAHRAAVSAAQKGRKASQETRAKLSAMRRGIKFTEEHKSKLSESLKGRKLSQETKEKLSRIFTGHPRSLFWVGRQHRPESIAKMSASKKGRPCSEAQLRGLARARAAMAEKRASIA